MESIPKHAHDLSPGNNEEEDEDEEEEEEDGSENMCSKCSLVVPDAPSSSSPPVKDKFVYTIDYWLDFPTTEYGGVIVVVADNDDECVSLINSHPDYYPKIHGYVCSHVIRGGTRMCLKHADEVSRVVKFFIT